jgi:uncharacterized protein
MFQSLRIKFNQVKKKIRKQGLKKALIGILTSRSDPHHIAMGAATGVFFSVLPTFGIGMIIALLIAWKFRMNMIATYLGTLLTNPFTASVVYVVNYSLGSLITGAAILPVEGILPLSIEKFSQAALQLYIGGLMIAILASALCYGLVYHTVSFYQKTKKKRISKS